MEATVLTTAGRVRGVADGEAMAFLGVPYGAARRFHPPEPPPPWSGVRDATAFGPACPPTLSDPDRAYFARSALWNQYAGYDVATRFSEDCLNLNVWTPALDGGGRPVLVWLHGGGFSWGSGAGSLTRGDRLAARHGTVVVTVNHRLGVLGHLQLDGIPGSGVAGVLDLRLALAWVRDNIAAFGGDPENVTIAGHSGGSAKVTTLLGLPAARGLFSRAVMQSGLMELEVLDHDHAAATAAQLIERAGGADPAALPVDELTRLAAGLRLRPALDGEHLPAHPFDAGADVPLLIGTNTHDTATFKFEAAPGYDAVEDDAGLRAVVAAHPSAMYGDEAGAVIAACPPGLTNAERLVHITTARLRERTAALAERKLAAGTTPVYMYVFAYEAPMPPGEPFAGAPMASHGLELPFTFDVADRVALTGDRPERLELAAFMSARVAAFARDGDPGWPAYDPAERRTMVFDIPPRVESDPYGRDQVRDG